MASRGTLVLLCTLAVLSSAFQDETLFDECTSQTQLLKRVSADLEVAIECGVDLPTVWTTQETAALLLSMRNVTDILHTHLLQECHGAHPKKCPLAEVPHKGGMACVTVADRRYCKPMCEHGYDFSFLRRSRPYEECNSDTGFKWRSQFVGGNKLAVCHESRSQVSGVKTAYFPKDQDCLTTKTNSSLQSGVIADLTAELTAAGVQGAPESTCLVCG